MPAGSVWRDGAKVRLSAELADCETSTTIWSDRFAGAVADL
jgi:TolB-like protein